MSSPYRLRYWTARWFYAVFGLLFLSGLGWWITQRFFQIQNDFQVESHWSQRWWQALHGLAAMGALVVLGCLLPTHMRLAWQARKNRLSGASIVCINVALVMTGYGLYYGGAERLRQMASLWHTWLGLGFPIFLVFHVWLGRRSVRK